MNTMIVLLNDGTWHKVSDLKVMEVTESELQRLHGGEPPASLPKYGQRIRALQDVWAPRIVAKPQAADVRMMSVLAGVDTRSINKAIRGEFVRGLAGHRIEELLAQVDFTRHGWKGRLTALYSRMNPAYIPESVKGHEQDDWKAQSEGTE